MNLLQVETNKTYYYDGAVDKKSENLLKAYGFLKGVKIEIVSVNKYGDRVVRILGSKFCVNRILANSILVKEVKNER